MSGTEDEAQVELPGGWALDSLVGPRHVEDERPWRDADHEWDLVAGLGTAWVFCAPAHDKRLVEPVIVSDGFNSGPTDIRFIYGELESGLGGEGSPGYTFITELNNRGKDVIILGYSERSASILENAKAAIRCIELAIEESPEDARLAVGGFSMGGLVTRYALAKIETDGDLPSHQTATYFSYDSPHRGAWIPISLQAFAHFFKAEAPAASAQINSPAAQELLLHHLTTHNQTAVESPSDLRTAFLTELERVGGFPKAVGLTRVGVANGPVSGVPNSVEANKPALTYTAYPGIYPAKLWTQSDTANQVVAQLWKTGMLVAYKRKTTGMLEFDGAPGGMLPSFKIAADALNVVPEPPATPLPGETVAHYDSICFIPVASAVAVRDIDDHASLYEPILDTETSDLHDYQCASHSEAHSLMTEQLGGWLVEQIAPSVASPAAATKPTQPVAG